VPVVELLELSPVVDEVSPPPSRLDTSPDLSPPSEATAVESDESELSEEESLDAVDADRVTILFSPDIISVQISVSSETCMKLVHPLLEEPRLALVEEEVVEELELEELPEELFEPLLEDRLLLIRRLEIT
jgi:hypothetical protein